MSGLDFLQQDENNSLLRSKTITKEKIDENQSNQHNQSYFVPQEA
jgi:hypothetical protein